MRDTRASVLRLRELLRNMRGRGEEVDVSLIRVHLQRHRNAVIEVMRDRCAVSREPAAMADPPTELRIIEYEYSVAIRALRSGCRRDHPLQRRGRYHAPFR